MTKTSGVTWWAAAFLAGLVLASGSGVGLHFLPDPPDPSQGLAAYKAYERWMDLWLLIAAPAAIGLLILATVGTYGLLEAGVWLWRSLVGTDRERPAGQ